MNDTETKTQGSTLATLTPRQRKAIYNRWKNMIRRCSRSENADYERYGGRGIRIAEEWKGASGFENFLEHVVQKMPRPNNMNLDDLLFPAAGRPWSFDRSDNDGDYSPGNLAWATPKQQSDNQRGRVRREVAGERMTRADAARLFGVDPRTAACRQRRGYAPDEATELPIGGRTAVTRHWRDAVIEGMIKAGLILVDDQGFIFVRGANGLQPVRVAPASGGRYLNVSLSVPQAFHGLIPQDRLAKRIRSGTYRDGFGQHRVVATYHLPRPVDEGYHEVDHANGDKRDNRPDNLRWSLPSSNRPGGRRRP